VQCDGPVDFDAVYRAVAPRLGTDRLDLIDLRRAGPLSLASRRHCDTDKLRRARRRAIHAFVEREDLA
jgi:hypothetical protein